MASGPVPRASTRWMAAGGRASAAGAPASTLGEGERASIDPDTPASAAPAVAASPDAGSAGEAPPQAPANEIPMRRRIRPVLLMASIYEPEAHDFPGRQIGGPSRS